MKFNCYFALTPPPKGLSVEREPYHWINILTLEAWAANYELSAKGWKYEFESWILLGENRLHGLKAYAHLLRDIMGYKQVKPSGKPSGR